MGRPKQLLPWGSATLIEWQVAQMRDAGVDDIIVVLGHDASSIAAALPNLDARIVVNENYREGRASSLRTGAEAVADGTATILVLSADQPRPAWLSRLLIERWRETHASLVIPTFEERSGHPVLLDGALLSDLRNVNEQQLGLRAVVEKHNARASKVPIANSLVNVDLNLPRDYEEAHAHYLAGDWG